MVQGRFLPKKIHEFLHTKVLGQTEALEFISVAIYKHIHHQRAGNLLLIGNSGSGKTTIMNAIKAFYDSYEELKVFRIMVIMNANMLGGEDESDVQCLRLFKAVENKARSILGEEITAEQLKAYMENATICLDEVDKISSRIAGKVNVAGLAIQQALLTIMEGETVHYETTLKKNGIAELIKIPIDTRGLLFVCGGAYEELYDQVYSMVISKEDKRQLKPQMIIGREGKIRFESRFSLKEFLKFEDLFRYGMVPQFISRFNAAVVLNNLNKENLKQIMLTAQDSPYCISRDYFQSMNIRLELTEEAFDLIAEDAEENSRIGARALREVFSRIITRFEFDPFDTGMLVQDGEKWILRIDENMVKSAI